MPALALGTIEGASVTPLRQIHAPKGDLFHGLKASEESFGGFGEAYFTTVHAGDTKGWRKHSRMRLNLVVIQGSVTFFVHDETSGEGACITLGPGNYGRLTVHPGLWVAFRGGDHDLNLLLNLASIEHDPDEATAVDLDAFPFADTASGLVLEAP